MVFLNKTNYDQLLQNILFCSVGCLVCYFLQKYLSVSSVLSSVLVGFVGSFLPKSKLYDSGKAVAAIYCGSFAAMSGFNHFSRPLYVFILSFIVGVCFTVCSPYFRGIGGKLGTIAFISASIFIFGRLL